MKLGAEKANIVAESTLAKVKQRVGLSGPVEKIIESKQKETKPKIFKENGKFYYRKDNILFGPYDTYKEIQL